MNPAGGIVKFLSLMVTELLDQGYGNSGTLKKFLPA